MYNETIVPLWKRITAVLFISVWMVWAYIRLSPPAALIRHGQLVASLYDNFAFKNLAYSDVVKLYETRHLYLHLVPYIHNLIEYPVVTGLFMQLTALGQGFHSYFLATFIIFWAIALFVYFLLERLAPKSAIYFAVLPLLVVYGLLNWDMLGIGFMVAAWYFYRREKYMASSILFAFGVFAKLFPIFFLPFIIAEMWAKPAQRRTLGRMVLVFFATSIVINVPFAIGNVNNWSYFFTYNAGRGLGADLYANALIHGISISTANIFSLGMVVLATLFFMWRTYRGGRVVDAAAITFTVFLFFNKVYSPQYTLWVFVLAILAEWPIWSYLAITLMGIFDYVNSFTVLYLLSSKQGSAGWYVGHVFEPGVLFRYITLAVVGFGAAFHTSRAADERSRLGYSRAV
jgi:hypothetical protein